MPVDPIDFLVLKERVEALERIAGIAPEPRKAREFMVLCDDKGQPADGSIVGARWYKFREVLDGT